MHDKNDTNSNLELLKNAVKNFVDARDWNQFHTHKDLATNLMIESGELAELFIWKTEDEVKNKLTTEQQFKINVADELSDVILSCLLLANKMNLDVTSSLLAKIEKTAQKYPVEKSKGSNKKYNEL
jgi:NTP pyrophosphatase (non-canonical NTP hydrolase)